MAKRIRLEVYIDLDPIPGTFHTKESAQETIAYLLDNAFPHYKPEVRLSNSRAELCGDIVDPLINPSIL